jgi:hypothetical protein
MKKIYEDMRKVFEAKVSFRILCGIGIGIIAMLIFSAGIIVGFHKASFGRAWGENYNENFGMGHRIASMGGIEKTGMMDYFPNAHGAVGKIIKIELPNIIVQDKDNTEKSVLIGADTKIQQGRIDVATADLKIDDFVVIIGTPDDKGIIEAKFIRVLPQPEFLNK